MQAFTGTATATRCPRCAAPMAVLQPAGRAVTEVDHCAACALVWFDPLEFDGLDRAAWVALLLGVSARSAEPALPVGARWACPRCQQPLQPRALAGSHGRHTAQACPAGHGQAHGVTALLASRGLLQPLGLAERLLLQRSRQGLNCLACGAGLTAHDEACAHCGSPLLCVDVPRLAQALGADAPRAGRRAPPADGRGAAPVQPWRWSCHGCGRSLDPSVDAECSQCSAPVQAPRLADLAPLLEQARRRLEAEQARALQQALGGFSEAERHRVARVTQRPEHVAASVRADRRWWWRLGAIGVAFVASVVVAWCSG